MRKSVWVRALIGIWGFWITAALSEPAGLHTCAMHGSQSVHVHNGASELPAAEHHTGAPSDHAKAVCTCLGLCCGASIAAPWVAVEVASVALTWNTNPDFAAVAAPNLYRPHALPFANGPPTAL